MESDFESWEDYFQLHEERDYPALVKHCETALAAAPGEAHAIEQLGEAYVLNGQYRAAIDLVGHLHDEHPEIESFAHILLDALFGLRKDEDDFPWKRRPKVLRLSPHVVDLCYENLRQERESRPLYEIYERMSWVAYLAFSEKELLDLLRREERFLIVEGSEPSVALRKANLPSRRHA